MAYVYNAVTGEIIDSDDGQIIATMSDSATPEQGECLVKAYNDHQVQPKDALLDPKFRNQMQGLKDMTAALNGTPSSPVVFSTDEKTVLENPDINKPVRTLLCCCCGGYTRGRQFHNQDTGYGLGSCCVDYVSGRCENMERTYGVAGVHYSVPEFKAYKDMSDSEKFAFDKRQGITQSDRDSVGRKIGDYVELIMTMRSKATFGTSTDTIRVWNGQTATEVANHIAKSCGADVVSLVNFDGTPFEATQTESVLS